MKVCPHCREEFKPLPGKFANHVRWCKQNPKIEGYIARAKCVDQMLTEEARHKANAGIKKAHENGKYDHVEYGKNGWVQGSKHSPESIEKMRKAALASPHRRLRRKIIDYKGVKLDSTWELILAKRLDFLGVKWERPPPVRWIDSASVWHNYFADFYLPDQDIYLDPKNPYAMQVQADKIKCLLEQFNNLYFIESLEECEQYSV